MRRLILASVLGGLLVGCVVAETNLPGHLAGFRAWTKLTDKPEAVPYRDSLLCVVPPPTLAELERHGPHTARWIMVYANPLAAKTLNGPATRFPPGAIIAKDKVRQPGGAETDGVAFMIKHPVGEFTASGGWEFLYYPSSGTKPTYDTCISCHRAGGTKDYVFGRYGLSAAQ